MTRSEGVQVELDQVFDEIIKLRNDLAIISPHPDDDCHYELSMAIRRLDRILGVGNVGVQFDDQDPSDFGWEEE